MFRLNILGVYSTTAKYTEAGIAAPLFNRGGGKKIQKNVAHHGWATKKILLIIAL